MDPPQIMIRGSQGQINLQQLTCYLTQTTLLLRDRDNKQESILLCGTGSAIPTCILIAEIVARKLPGLGQVTEFVTIESKGKIEGQDQREGREGREGHVAGIRIKLTYKPSEEDKHAPGYQQNEVSEEKAKGWASLYEFVMQYVNDLAAAKIDRQRQKYSQSQFSHKTYRDRDDRPPRSVPKEDRPIPGLDRSDPVGRRRFNPSRRPPRNNETDYQRGGQFNQVKRGEQRTRGGPRGGDRETQRPQEFNPEDRGEVRTRGGNRQTPQ